MPAPDPSERRARYVEALLFWAITLVVCAGAGYGSYRYGRSWIGDRLKDEVKPVLTSDQLSSRIRPEVFERGPEGEGSDVSEEPPKEAVVEVKAVPVTASDREKLETEAENKADEGAEAPETPTEEDRTRTGDKDEEPKREAREQASASPRQQATSPPIVRASGQSVRYVVRAGAFRTRANAERVVDQLRTKGYSPYLTTVIKDGVEYTRVNVASYATREEALKLRGELRGEGYSDVSIATE